MKQKYEEKEHISINIRDSIAKYWGIKNKYKISNPVSRITSKKDVTAIERLWKFLRE